MYWNRAHEREQRRLMLYKVLLAASILAIAITFGSLLVYIFDGCQFPHAGYEGCCSQVVAGQSECPGLYPPPSDDPRHAPSLGCCVLSSATERNCSVAYDEGFCSPPRTDEARTPMALSLTFMLVFYMVLCMAWPLYVYTKQEAIHPLFVRIARSAVDDITETKAKELANDVANLAAQNIVGILPSEVRHVVDRTTQEALHEPLRVVLPALLWAWLSPQGQLFVDAWAAKGTKKLGKRTSGRILFLSAALNRADLLRSLYTSHLTEANLAVLNGGCEIGFADLDPVPWRLFVQAVLTAGILNILAPIGSLNMEPDTYPQRMPPPLIVAAVLGHADVVVALLEMRANPNITYAGGMTPLHYAAKYGFGDVAKLLIFSGANPDAKSNAGATPMDLCVANEVQVVMKAAVAAKRKVDQAAADTALSPIESEALLLFGEMRLTERTTSDSLKATFRGMSVGVFARAVPRDQHKAILSEAAILRTLKHPNLVSIYGVALGPEDKRLYFMQEPIEADTLLDYVRQRARRGQPLTLQNKRSLAVGIADGMISLTASGLVHKHLAARNVFAVKTAIGTELVPKISNILLGEEITNVDIPWTAPESLRDPQQHTVASDVWSFGVLYWELLTDGLVPFGTALPDDVRARILGGETLARIPNVPSDDIMLMMDCWLVDTEMRPTFKQLKRRLEQLQSSVAIARTGSLRHSQSSIQGGSKATSAPSETTALLARRGSRGSLSGTSPLDD